MSNIKFVVDDQVATITLDRPEKLNTVTPAMIEELGEIADRCNADGGIRAVILTGAGDRAFCAGSDITTLDSYQSDWDFRNRKDYCDAIRGITKPVIAAINGYAYGGGLELCLSSDIRIASENATFCAAEIKLGWIGGGGVSVFLAHSIGPSNAAKMLLTGEPEDATTALVWGLVSAMVRSDQLHDHANRLANKIARNAPIAAQTAKQNLRAAFRMSIEDAVAYERDLQSICMATEDAKEGQRAFKEQREPKFRGQ